MRFEIQDIRNVDVNYQRSEMETMRSHSNNMVIESVSLPFELNILQNSYSFEDVELIWINTFTHEMAFFIHHISLFAFLDILWSNVLPNWWQ